MGIYIIWKDRDREVTEFFFSSFFFLSLDLDAAPGSNALEEISDEEAVSLTPFPPIPPVSTSLRNYVDHSETLTKLVELGK